jgi:hypothetical protein
MAIQGDRLDNWKQLAQIFSLIAIPIVLAVMGYLVQRSLAESGLKKDYVQMALGVLKEQPSKENAQLRQWAISVLDKNSPVPIPSSLRAQLVNRTPFAEFFNESGEATLKPTIICKPVPNPETLEWLIANDPRRYSRCANGQVGETQWNFMKVPKSAASAAN